MMNLDNKYKNSFNEIISKQVNHLMNEIDRSSDFNDKMIGCTAIIIQELLIKTIDF